MDILIIVIAVIGGISGLLSTLFLALSLPVVIVWKLYRKIRYNISVMY